jgi:hypothetical protein
MKALLVRILLVCISGAARLRAQEAATPINSSKLLELCSAPDVPITVATPPDTPLKGAMCYGFLMGADQGTSLFARDSYCLEPGVDFKEIRLVVLKYLNAHSEQLHKPAAESMLKALGEAFPCKKR